jgi:hypothetical protein
MRWSHGSPTISTVTRAPSTVEGTIAGSGDVSRNVSANGSFNASS